MCHEKIKGRQWRFVNDVGWLERSSLFGASGGKPLPNVPEWTTWLQWLEQCGFQGPIQNGTAPFGLLLSAKKRKAGASTPAPGDFRWYDRMGG
jgi:hypothetical protein